MSWRQWVSEALAHGEKYNVVEPQFYTPATSAEIAEAEWVLRVEFPDELRSLLMETNGVMERMKVGEAGDEIEIGHLLWPVSRILEGNLSIRDRVNSSGMYMPLDHLLFVADAGNGDLFGYAIWRDGIQRTDIFAWDHENDSRTWVAPSLRVFLDWWTAGKIST